MFQALIRRMRALRDWRTHISVRFSIGQQLEIALWEQPGRWLDDVSLMRVVEDLLNPILYFFDTLKNREVKYDLEKVHTYYDRVASYLGVQDPDQEKLNFIRIANKPGGEEKYPNVVIVFLESFAYYKTSVSGNPLDPTPYFKEMTKNGLLFTRFYTPQAGTAQSIFTTITGIPDVELNKTSSRNPLVVRQHSIVNAFEGYEKFYFPSSVASVVSYLNPFFHKILDIKTASSGVKKALIEGRRCSDTGRCHHPVSSQAVSS